MNEQQEPKKVEDFNSEELGIMAVDMQSKMSQLRKEFEVVYTELRKRALEGVEDPKKAKKKK